MLFRSDTNVILPQLLEFLQAKDLALFRFFPVALCQALGDNLLPFLQEFLRVLEVIVLSVKVAGYRRSCFRTADVNNLQFR